jgi:hypothetical protein
MMTFVFFSLSAGNGKRSDPNMEDSGLLRRLLLRNPSPSDLPFPSPRDEPSQSLDLPVSLEERYEQLSPLSQRLFNSEYPDLAVPAPSSSVLDPPSSRTLRGLKNLLMQLVSMREKN